MSEVVIAVESRNVEVKAKDIRSEGKILGVLYGNGVDSIPVQFDYQAFRKAYRTTGDSTLLTLDFEGKKISTLVHDVSYHPVSDEFLHVDFLAINDAEPTKAHIPIVLDGLAPAVKNLTAVLLQPLPALEVSCLPKYLKREIVVDVTGLEKFHDTIHVADLDIAQDQNISIITDSDAVVVTANPPKGYAYMKKEDESE